MLRIGLTGGIGSGKSAAADCFAQLQVPVVDADKVTRELLGSSEEVRIQLIKRWGDGCLGSSGALDRHKIRDRIFDNPQDRCWLEQLLHPKIKIEMEQFLSRVKAPYAVLVVPLLFEHPGWIQVDRILVVNCPLAIRLARLRQRGYRDMAQIITIIRSQVRSEYGKKLADDFLDNDASLANLANQVKELHNSYLSLATKCVKLLDPA